MFRFNKIIILALGVSLIFLQACEKFNEMPRLSESQPIIISDPALSENGLGAKLAMEGVEGVVDIKLTKDEDEVTLIPYGKAAFLAKPVSGIDVRVIAQDLPFAFNATQKGPNKIEAEAGKKLTDKQRKTKPKLTDVSSGIEYDDAKITRFQMKFNISSADSVPDYVLPSDFPFKLNKETKLFELKGLEPYYSFESDSVAKALLSASVAPVEENITGAQKEMKFAKLGAAGSNMNSFDFPNQFFIAKSGDTAPPTDLGSAIKIDTTQGMKLTWYKNTADNTVMSIRIFVHNPSYNAYQRKSVDSPFSQRMFIDTVDDGEYELKPADLEKLKVEKGKTVKARIFMYRTAINEFTFSAEAPQANAIKFKSSEEDDELDAEAMALLNDEDRQAAELLAAEDEEAKAEETEEKKEEPKSGKGVMLCSVGTTGMVDITTPDPDKDKKK